MIVERVPFRSLEEFDAISRACDATHEYTVAWFDSFAGRDSRGIFFRGNHARRERELRACRIRKRQLRLPHSRLVSPFLNPLTVRAFNTAYFRANAQAAAAAARLRSVLLSARCGRELERDLRERTDSCSISA